MEEVYVPKSPHEKALQRALIQYRNPKNHALVVEALTKAGRTDLIGFGKECLIRPRITKSEADRQYGKSGKTGRLSKAESERSGRKNNASKNDSVRRKNKTSNGTISQNDTKVKGKNRVKASGKRGGRNR